MHLNAQNVAYTVNRIFLIWNGWEIFCLTYNHVVQMLDRAECYEEDHPKLYQDTLSSVQKQSSHLQDALQSIIELIDDLSPVYPSLFNEFEKVFLQIEEMERLLTDYSLVELISSDSNNNKLDKGNIVHVIWDLLKAIQNHVVDMWLLSDENGNTISPRLVQMNPQSAIQSAFSIFEDNLRNRMGANNELYGQKLINQAYGKNGRLSYGATPAEKQGTRDLISGAYATFRNPRMHRIIEDDYQAATSIISLIDLLIKIIHESVDEEE